jgi:hypothetical protein
MKKTLLIGAFLMLLLLVAKCGYSQTWYGNNPTFTDGFVGAVDYTGTATITGHVTFTSASKTSLSTVDIKTGGRLTIQGSAELYAGSIVEAGSTLEGQDHLIFDGANTIAGTVTVVNTMLINNDGLTLSGCAFIKAGNLQIDNDNVLHGSGLIYVTGVYEYSGGNDGPTQDATIRINIPAHVSTNVGKATLTTANTAPCALSTPVTIINFSIKEDALNNVTASWTSTIEGDVSNYVIEGSSDGTNFVPLAQVATLAPGGNSSVATDYTVTFNNNVDVVIAGFSVIGFFLLMGFVGSTVRFRKALIAPLAVLLIAGASFASCSKTNGSKVEHTNKYTYFRLKTNFNDGTFTYLQQQWHL